MLKKTSSDIIKSIERSNKKVNKIPSLDHSKIKERKIKSITDIRSIENEFQEALHNFASASSL